MRPLLTVGWALLAAPFLVAAPSAAELGRQLNQVSLDPAQTYRVRELQLTRGDIKIYLGEGVLSFVTPVAGHIFAAVFTTQSVDAGEAEILVLPPTRSERASLASYTKSPNLDEHFSSAVFLFADDTAHELLAQIQQTSIRQDPALAAEITPLLEPPARHAASELSLRLLLSFLNNHPPSDGFFYGLIAGRTLGSFDLLYDPTDFEPVSMGRPSLDPNASQSFELWTAFRPRRATPYVPPPVRISGYRIDATIRSDLSLVATADFNFLTDSAGGRVIPLAFSEKLRVISASLDAQPVEVFQPGGLTDTSIHRRQAFLLVSDQPLVPASRHAVHIRYAGSVIHQTAAGAYFVDERNIWYPQTLPLLTNFDLTFHFPAQLDLVSTGELIDDQTANGIRTVHRRTEVPEALAGFNLGAYTLDRLDHGPYHIECYANRNSTELQGPIGKETGKLLDFYTALWTKLPIHGVAISPIEGSFGQGFPGLIYLSDMAYVRPEQRPASLRTARSNTFFADMLLPHEVAHQWWGNIVVPANYRTDWLVEAMATYSALQYLESGRGLPAVNAVLNQFRQDLTQPQNGAPPDAAGPVDFGFRLLDASNVFVWQTVTYGKGAWILHMLRERMGEAAFQKLQIKLLTDYADKPIANEDLRRLASGFIPAGQPDRALTLFFDTWVYGSGIPHLTLSRIHGETAVGVSGVDDDFIADLPLQCRPRGAGARSRWVRISSGSNTLDSTYSGCQLPPPDSYLYIP